MPAVMRSARSRILLLAKALSVAGLIGGGMWLAGAPEARNASRDAITLAHPPGRGVVHFAEAVRDREEPATETSRAEAIARAAAPVATLTVDAAAEFVALCQLRLLAADIDLDLSHRQWAKLAAATSQAQAVRLAYEAEVATVREIAPGRFRVEIPAYAAAGDELRQRFMADLREGLGEAVAAEIMAMLGAKLEGSFAGFGVSNQTLEITGDARRSPASVRVERTARFWNSAANTEQATTRREVLLPLAEDPTGEAWTPLLALVGKAD